MTNYKWSVIQESAPVQTIDKNGIGRSNRQNGENLVKDFQTAVVGEPLSLAQHLSHLYDLVVSLPRTRVGLHRIGTHDSLSLAGYSTVEGVAAAALVSGSPRTIFGASFERITP
ncbi:hypothetical protein R6Q59_015784 [Mikania micrantha]